ncbi:MAG: HAMP domain-containing histidine kinase [Clostridia bacterium]|nr:HAMP domain-containing histidine kinase [Clostridia bacterium]
MNRKHEKHVSKHGLRWRVFACFAAFTAVILLLLWLCQVVFLDEIYKSIKTGEIKNAANKLTAKIESDDLEESAQTIAEKDDVCIMVLQMLNEQYAVQLVSVDNLNNCVIHRMSNINIANLYSACKKNGGKKLLNYDEQYREEGLTVDFFTGRVTWNGGNGSEQLNPQSIIYTQITKSNGNTYFVLLNSVISPVAATVRTLNILLIVISVILILLAFVLAMFMAKGIASPIIKITESAKKLALGRYDAVFTGNGYKEIDELAKTLNYAENELSIVDTMRRDLLANISHDLRTPLTMISGYSEAMRDIPGENTPENAQIILDEANRLTSLVNDVLDISRLEDGSSEIRFESTNLTATVRMSIEKYSRLCEKEGYEITFSADEDIYTVTDGAKFMQALYNLINNALTYTGEDKKIYVEQTTDGKNVRISVTDTGDGIPADKLPFIWDRYYKVDRFHRRAAHGSGLGLSIVRNIMNMLGGSYGVVSTEGEGSRFWIEVPLTEKRGTETASEEGVG